MTSFVQFVVLGLGLGAIYALLAQGVVLIYRGSGVVNFAHGAFALFGAAVFVETRGLGWAPALVLAIVATAVLGTLVQVLVMRRLRDAAALTRIIATLGLLIALQALATLRYGDDVQTEAPYLPRHAWDIAGVTVQSDRLILLVLGIVMTVALTVMQRRWIVALATRAMAENELAASVLGWSPGRLAAANWALGGALAGAAGALIVPLTGLIVTPLTLLVVPALAAALLGRFDSFYATFAGALFVGVGQSLIQRYWQQPGATDAIPFLVIIVVLVVTGRSLPLRGHVTDRLPILGDGRIRPVPVLATFAVMTVLMLAVFNGYWQDAFTFSGAIAIVFLSVVVVTGYAGQLSLAQYTLAGMGAYVAGRLVAAEGWPYWLAMLTGVVASIPLGLVVALPALRTRGVNLAVVTLGVAVAVSSMLFQNVELTGGIQGTPVGDLRLFGIDLNSTLHPGRYGVLVLIAFFLAAVMVANLRRSFAGRRLIAIRGNERAAASLGVSVVRGKLYAFAVAAGLAALGGVLIGFRNTNIVYTSFDPMGSIQTLAYSVIGGLGYVVGPLLGSTFPLGGIGSLFDGALSGIEKYLPLIGGTFVVLLLVINPNGLVPGHAGQLRWLGRRLRGIVPERARIRLSSPRRAPAVARVSGPRTRVAPRALEVRGLTVRFGAVVALDDVDLDVAPGEIVGLIGPNGAGKTTLIDAVSGFVTPSAGQLTLGGDRVGKRSASARVRAGLARSWQSLELFEDISVRENLLIAAESRRRSWVDSVRALVWPGRSELTDAAAAAVSEFELLDDLELLPGSLPYGRRRLVGIARAVALNPSVLLLDEPAAGLDTGESAELGALVRRLAQQWGMGVLLVEHDVNLVMSTCDRVAVLDFGRKIAEGTPDEVRNDSAVISAYLGVEEDELEPADISFRAEQA